jgi:hypothetical protein
VREAEKPILGHEEEYAISAVLIAWIDDTVADSLAAILARRKFGMAMAAIIKITATTTSNSIKEKPRDLRGFPDSTT